MKQNSIFSYVKRNNNSEVVDGNKQCSSNVKEGPYPKRNKCNSIAKVRKWEDAYLRYEFFLSDGQIQNVEDKFQNAKTTQSSNFLLFNFCNKCLFVEVSNNEIFDFLTCNSCFLNFC